MQLISNIIQTDVIGIPIQLAGNKGDQRKQLCKMLPSPNHTALWSVGDIIKIKDGNNFLQIYLTFLWLNKVPEWLSRVYLKNKNKRVKYPTCVWRNFEVPSASCITLESTTF